MAINSTFNPGRGKRGNFPTVDAVRKKARVNMNDASTGMKEWRRAQSATANPVPPQLPPELQASCSSALAVLWAEATSLANESLRAAKAGWEAERQEAEELARQMTAAYDLQAAELEAAQHEVKSLNADAAAMRDAMHSTKSALEAVERTKALAENRTSQAELTQCRSNGGPTNCARNSTMRTKKVSGQRRHLPPPLSCR